MTKIPDASSGSAAGEPPPPTPEEIDPFGDLDGAAALRAFGGKTRAEAEAMFRSQPLARLEDLFWMGPRAFDHYVPAAIRAVVDDPGGVDLDSVRALASALENRLGSADPETDPDAETDAKSGSGSAAPGSGSASPAPPPDASIRRLVTSACRSLVERFESFDPGEHDRDLPARLQALATRYDA